MKKGPAVGYRLDVVGSLSGLNHEAFDAIDPEARPGSSYGRLRQLESDRRWHCAYALVQQGDQLVAAVPFYRCRARMWPDAAYDPERWGSAPAPPMLTTVVGGRADATSGLHVAPAHRSPLLRDLLVAALKGHWPRTAHMTVPFVTDTARAFWGSSFEWRERGRDGVFMVPPDGLARDVRRRLRKDLELREAVGLRCRPGTWSREWAELVSEHKTRLGVPEPAEFVEARLPGWGDAEDLTVLGFDATAGDLHGILIALAWRDGLECHDMGLDGEPSPERQALYAEMLYHAPMRYALEHGISSVRTGFYAPDPKRFRGARFERIHGGRLDATWES